MASACRSAVMACRRSMCSRPNPIIKTVPIKHRNAAVFSSSTGRVPLAASRFTSVLGCLETMMPLHSAIAAARLKSKIAVDTTSWSLLSQDWNSSVNNNPNKLASGSIGLNQERSLSPSSVILLVLMFSIFWRKYCIQIQEGILSRYPPWPRTS